MNANVHCVLQGDFDKEEQVEAFENTKAGIKGLVDAGIETLPKMFIQPADEIFASIHSSAGIQIPVIDLAGLQNENDREKIVQEVLYASEKWGFFQVVNHGIPLDVLDNMIQGVRMFHEQDTEVKKEFYSCHQKQVEYNSNYDRRMEAANWRDTLTVNNSYASRLDPTMLPSICRNAILEHTSHVLKLGNVLLELLSLALGLRPDYLKETECDKGWTAVYHYYPACPQPELALGSERHSDSSFITVLLQDQLGGLQVHHEKQWVDVQPVAGALIINIGDVLQMISNDRLKSVLHRVRVNRASPRVSAAVFFTGLATSPKRYAPIKELLSEENPPIYTDFTIGEFLENYFSRSLVEDKYKHFMIKDRNQSN